MVRVPTNVPSTWDVRRQPQDDEELWWMVRGLWGIKIPRTPVCHGHVSPFDAFADAFFAKSSVAVWKASRGFGGKTRTLSALTLTEAAVLGAEVSILGGSGAQSLNVHNATKEMWGWPNSPRSLLAGDPTQYDTKFNNSAHIRSLLASQTSVRGAHPQRLRLDEIDEMDQAILEGAQGQPMRKRKRFGIVETQTVMSSTHQYPDKTMKYALDRAADKGWPVFEWCWRETSNPVDGWLTEDEVERKKTEIAQHMWETEYDLQEPSFAGRAIDSEMVEVAFNKFLHHFDHDEPHVYQDEEVYLEGPQAGHHYITGVDWAKEKDWTIIATFDATDDQWVCVAWKKVGRLPWPTMIRFAYDRWRTYGGILAHDNTGIGDVIHDNIVEMLSDDFGHGSFHTNRMLQDLKDLTLGGGRARHDLFSDYIGAIENGQIMYPRIEFAFNEHKYATMDDLFGSGHAPDSFIAGAVAYHYRPRGQGALVVPVGVDRTSPWANA